MIFDNLTIILISLLAFFAIFSILILIVFVFVFKNYKKENKKANDKLILLFEKIDFILKQQINKEELLETFFEKNDSHQNSIEGDLEKLKKDFNLIENNQQFIIKNKLNKNEVKSLGENLKNLKNIDQEQINRNTLFINEILNKDNQELFGLDNEDDPNNLSDSEINEELNNFFESDENNIENQDIFEKKLDEIEKGSIKTDLDYVTNEEVKDLVKEDVNLFGSLEDNRKYQKDMFTLAENDSDLNDDSIKSLKVKLINNISDKDSKYINEIFSEFKKNNKYSNIDDKLDKEKNALQNNIEEDEN